MTFSVKEQCTPVVLDMWSSDGQRYLGTGHKWQFSGVAETSGVTTRGVGSGDRQSEAQSWGRGRKKNISGGRTRRGKVTEVGIT